MLDRMSRDWWIIALQGVAAIVFGVLALVWPGITLLALVWWRSSSGSSSSPFRARERWRSSG